MSVAVKPLMLLHYLFAITDCLLSLVPGSFKMLPYTSKFKTFARSIMNVFLSCVRPCYDVSTSALSSRLWISNDVFVPSKSLLFFPFFQRRMPHSTVLTSFHCWNLSCSGFIFTEKPKYSKTWIWLYNYYNSWGCAWSQLEIERDQPKHAKHSNFSGIQLFI